MVHVRLLLVVSWAHMSIGCTVAVRIWMVFSHPNPYLSTKNCTQWYISHAPWWYLVLLARYSQHICYTFIRMKVLCAHFDDVFHRNNSSWWHIKYTFIRMKVCWWHLDGIFSIQMPIPALKTVLMAHQVHLSVLEVLLWALLLCFSQQNAFRMLTRALVLCSPAQISGTGGTCLMHHLGWWLGGGVLPPAMRVGKGKWKFTFIFIFLSQPETSKMEHVMDPKLLKWSPKQDPKLHRNWPWIGLDFRKWSFTDLGHLGCRSLRILT